MKIQNINGHHYRLPNELSDFKLKMYVHLINWKWAQGIKAPGHNEHKGELLPYDAILPDDYVAEKRMPHIYQSSVKHLLAHHERNPFRYHPHFYHMSSSQAANINLFLPILHHDNASAILAGIQGAPKDFMTLDKCSLDNGYCLEFWGGNFGEDKKNKGPLGDKSARSGTDADIAIAYHNKLGELCLWLIEHKLTEEEFSTCGGFKSDRRQSCHDCTRNFTQIINNKDTCYQHAVRLFKYWDITATNDAFFANAPTEAGCPFQGGMNQLWRNQLLGLAIENEGKEFKHAHFSVVHHPANTALKGSLDGFKALIANNPKFSVFTSSDVLRAAEKLQDDALNAWATWYRNLYML
ncbi:MAG TPA: hypothetical protein P5567_11555 [Kiritimatiellia bacterium]|nr:hypothetical protein [Kiritimatiellia bacterium]HSA17497.1 hypothetical protein [Kiritimatiellia bacterium]